tara:strand:+ start:106 stop:1008 length:903 start_codon:yes stop_codon:yes gene_type:complete
MAFNLTTICMKDDPDVTPQDVFNLKVNLDKQRLIMHEGMQISRFVVISDYDKEEFLKLNIYEDDPADISPVRFLKVPTEEVHHPSFHQRNVFKNTLFGQHDKTMFIDANVMPLQLSHSLLFSSLPDKGDPEHSSYKLADDQKEKIIENNWATLNMALDWSETEDTMFLPYFYQHNYGDHEELVAKMYDKDIISKYTTFAHFLEGEFDEFLLPFQPGVIGKYFVKDKEKNDNLNAMWEKNVRPEFPAQWRGTGGDEESAYIEWEHEYRTTSRQCSMMYFDRHYNGDFVNPSDDYYLRLWLL